MLRFYAERWLAIESLLQQMASAHLLLAQDRRQTSGLNERVEGLRDSLIRLLEGEVKTFPFSPAISRQITRYCDVLRTVDQPPQTSVEVLQALSAELIFNVQSELESNVFLVVHPSRRQLFEQAAPQFGVEVETQFPQSSKDIAAAGRCYALEEWTACVFHSMRVLEHGLRAMATRFDVPCGVDSWHKIISGIEDGLTRLRNKHGLTDQDRNEITHYSDAAAQFRYFKDAWRNHVSHSGEFYDERDAEKVFRHVREFMQQLARVA